MGAAGRPEALHGTWGLRHDMRELHLYIESAETRIHNSEAAYELHDVSVRVRVM